MRKIAFYLMILMFFLSQTSFAQSKRDKNSPLIHINEKGEILDVSGVKLGYIDANNIVKNTKQENLYYIDREGNVVDNSGKYLGKSTKTGSFTSAEGDYKLEVRCVQVESCEIFELGGQKVGSVHENYKLHACATRCFFIKRKK